MTLETLLSCFNFREGDVFEVSNKLEPLMSKLEAKENAFIYERTKSFFENLVEAFEVSL